MVERGKFADIIRGRRKQLGIRLEKLEKKTGLTIVRISALERGVDLPTDAEIEAFLRPLNLQHERTYLFRAAADDAARVEREGAIE